jgi:non-canonical purine NTP pyrophosphatase (RdgB/HAM1 family)
VGEPGTFVLATTNPNKAREIREIFAACDPGIELVDRPPGVGEVEETEDTLLGNARLKARALVEATGMPAIAEDTGIEVEALAGAPGVRSARYAGEPSDEEANVDKVLAELGPRVGPEQRRARFVTVAIAMWPDGRETTAEGTVEGWIAGERRGRGGFGYDPVFVPFEADGRTFGELAEASPDAKNALSHRGRAFRALASGLAREPSGNSSPRSWSSLTSDAETADQAADEPGPEPADEPGPEPARRRRPWLPRTVRHLAELLIVGFIVEYFVVPQIGGTHEALHVLASANPFLPFASLVMESLSLIAYFEFTRSLIPKDSDPGLVTLSRIQLSTLALSHCVPGGNAVGYSLGYRLLLRSGVSTTDAGFALATQGLGSAVVLNAIFLLALIVSLPLYGFQLAYLLVAVIGVILMAFLAGLVVLFTKGDQRAAKLVRAIGARLPFLEPETLPRLFARLVARVKELSTDRHQLGKSVFFASANWLFDMGSLFLFVGAFGRWVNPVALIIAYGVANIAAALPITPGGLGVVEATVSSILVGFGTPRTIAIWGVIGWRLVNFWLPIPVGGAAYLSLKVHPPADNQAGLAARRALWRARWRWVVELFGRDAPTPVVDGRFPAMGTLEDVDAPAPSSPAQGPP